MRPADPRFSPGPTRKPAGWSPNLLAGAALGRSHRSPAALAKLREVLDRTRALLEIPRDYLIALTPASDTGAVESALWSLLGARGVDVLAWEAFGKDWVWDILKELKIKDARALEADYGELPDLGKVDFDRDVIFTWNGTTSGVRAPDGDWIAADRAGLVICDATSAAFAQALDWPKLDVVTYSWQKVMGGEAQHGMLILSPRAVERLESWRPVWPLPKLFRLTGEDGKLNKGLFDGQTINTPSLLAVEDHLWGLKWAARLGGLEALIARADANAAVIWDWIARTRWVENLCREPANRSNTGVCLAFADPGLRAAAPARRWNIVKAMTATLEREAAAYDIAAYRAAPAGLRIWCGATVETDDLLALTPWLDWAYDLARESQNET